MLFLQAQDQHSARMAKLSSVSAELMKIAEAIDEQAGWTLIGLYAMHSAMIAAIQLGVEVHDPWRAIWLFSIGVPMFVAWLVVVIEELTRTY
jgi:hypothetical protein